MAAQQLNQPGFRQTAEFLQPELRSLRRYFAAVLLIVLLAAGISYTLPWMQRQLIDALTGKEEWQIALLIAAVTALYGGEKLLQVLRNYFLKVLYNAGLFGVRHFQRRSDI